MLPASSLSTVNQTFGPELIQAQLLVKMTGQRGLALETQFDVYRRIMEIDFFAPLRLTQLLLPALVERRTGRIAVVSSVAGRAGRYCVHHPPGVHVDT